MSPLRGFAVVLSPQHDLPAQRRVRFADPHAWLLVFAPDRLVTVEEDRAAMPPGHPAPIRFPPACPFLDLPRLVSHVVWVGVPPKHATTALGVPAYAALTSVHLGGRQLEARLDPAEVLRAVRAHRVLWQDEADKAKQAAAAARERQDAQRAVTWAATRLAREAGNVRLYVPPEVA